MKSVPFCRRFQGIICLLGATLVMFFLASGISPCLAKLGATPDQCIAQYGNANLPKSLIITLRSGVFTYVLYTIEVFFLNNVVLQEFIFKTDHSSFSNEEQKEILTKEANLSSLKWEELADLPNTKRWIRQDGETASYYQGKEPMFILKADKNKKWLPSPGEIPLAP